MHVKESMSYILRGIPIPLWRSVKAVAATRGETVRAVLLRLLAEYAEAGHAAR